MDAICSGESSYKIVPTFDGIRKIFVNLYKEEIFSYFGKEYHLDRLKEVMKKNKPKLFCLNASENATKEIKEQARKFMEECFPRASKFEKL